VALGEEAATHTACPNGNDKAWLWDSFVGISNRFGHVSRNRAGDQQQVGVLRRSYKMDSESLHVIEWIRKRRNLDLAAVARSRVELPDIKRPAH